VPLRTSQRGLPTTSIEKAIQSPSRAFNRIGSTRLGNQGIGARNITIAVRIPGLTLRSVDVFLHNIGDIAIKLAFGKASAKKELTNIATDRQQ